MSRDGFGLFFPASGTHAGDRTARMPLLLKAHLGDQITLTDTATGAVVAMIEIDATRGHFTRPCLAAPERIRIDRVPLDDRIKQADLDALFAGEQHLVEDESDAGSGVPA
jgi:hypothetical protein